MSWISDNEWNLSLCMIQYYPDGNPHNFYRLADYIETEDGDYQLKWCNHRNKQQFDHFNPVTLKKRKLFEQGIGSDSDFVNLEWKPGKSDEGNLIDIVRLPLEGLESRVRHLEPIEYIDCHKICTYTQFRDLLKEGIPSYGKPTERFLVSFAEGDEPNTVKAILLNNKDVNYRDGKVALERYESGRLLSADVYTLETKYIKRLPDSSLSNDRYMYEATLLPNVSGTFAIRPLESYVADYVKWFSNVQDVTLTRTERQKISQLIGKALGAPEALERYVGANPSDDEVADMRSTLRRALQFDQDIMSELAVRILEEDEAFKDKCKHVLLSGDDPEMQTLRAEKEKFAKEREETQAQLQELRQAVENERKKLETQKNERTALEGEVQSITEQKSQILQQLQQDVALRIGLGTVASYTASQNRISSGVSIQQPIVRMYYELDEKAVSGKEKIVVAFSNNLKRMGLSSPLSESLGMRNFANKILLSLSATNILAVNSSYAPTVANALSIALCGRAASHVAIPESYADVDSIVEQCKENCCTVVVLDNVLDTVNEGLLFALSRGNKDIIFILPIGAAGNLKLLAPEVWEHVFYVPTEALACVPIRDIEEIKTQRYLSTWSPEPPNEDIYDDVLDEDAAVDPIKAVAPLASWFIPLEISYMFEKEYVHKDDDELDVAILHEWIGPQLLLVALSNGGDKGVEEVLSKLNDSNWNASEFLGRIAGLHEHGERS